MYNYQKGCSELAVIPCRNEPNHRLSEKETRKRKLRSRRRKKRKQYAVRGMFAALMVLLLLVCILAACDFRESGIVQTSVTGTSAKESTAALSDKLPESDFSSKNGLYYYTDPENGTTSKAGVDVSAAQGEIDWEQVRETGVEYAMIRLGYRGYGNGQIVTDDYFDSNFSEAANVGLDRGVYFFSQAINEDEAREEAEYVLEYLNGETLEYPIAYDFEYVGGYESRTLDLSWEQITNNAAAFCEVIQEAGYTPMIYTNAHSYSHYEENEQLAGVPVWYAQYESKTPDISDFYMWQYSCDGELEGITENTVDLNLVLSSDQ